MAASDRLADVQQAHHRRLLGLQEATAEVIGDAWDTFANLDDVAAAQFTAAADVVVQQASRSTSTIAVAYMQANDRIIGETADLVPIVPTIRNGTPAAQVYQRSIVEARRRVAAGAPYDEAMASGRTRAMMTARTDVSLANRAEITRGGIARPWVVGYRRVLTGQSCGFCGLASTQRYRSADLLPLHPGCDCDVAEIFGTADPGQIINRELLSALKDAGIPNDVTALRALPDARQAVTAQRQRIDELRRQLREETDQARTTRLEQRLERARADLAGKEEKVARLEQTKNAAGRSNRLIVDEGGKILGADGKPLQVATRPHGELGPTLSNKAHESAGAPSATPRRTRASVTDADVLAEARRRNVSPERVIDLREEKAARRFAEDRARREAAKTLAADSPDVRKVAERFGVDPDDVLTARARVADVRKVAREAAARVQADALRELDRLDAVRLTNPPRVRSKTGMGTAARRGEWDWLDQLTDKERGRLSRQWYGGSQAPDQMAHTMSEVLGRDLSVDEAMDLWLDLNRRAEAAGALRRGKLPSLDAYSDAIDPADLMRDLADQGYDPAILFGDDLTAAGHIASVDRQLVQSEALDYLGSAANAVEGPAPYRMSFATWEEEVRDLEYDLREGIASERARRRYAELIPQHLDGPDLGFEDLYARIVSTARKAGEEVPAHAVIPW